MMISAHNKQLLFRAKCVLKILSSLGINAVILGGLARDISHGVNARDADVWVYNKEVKTPKGLDNEVSAFITAMDEVDIKYELYDGTYPDGGLATVDSRIFSVVKLPELDIDVIWHSDAEDYTEVLKTFDYNINQYYIGLDGEAYHLDGISKEGKVLKLTNPDGVTGERQAYIIEKAKTLGWKV